LILVSVAPKLEDAALMEQLADRKESALGDLYDRYASRNATAASSASFAR